MLWGDKLSDEYNIEEIEWIEEYEAYSILNFESNLIVNKKEERVEVYAEIEYFIDDIDLVNYDKTFYEMILREFLLSNNVKYEEDYEDSYGCGIIVSKIGKFNMNMQYDKIKEMIDIFIKFSKLSYNDKKILYEKAKLNQKELYNEIRQYEKNTKKQFYKFYSKHGLNNDFFKNNNIIIKLDKLYIDTENEYNISDIIFGNKYSFFRIENREMHIKRIYVDIFLPILKSYFEEMLDKYDDYYIDPYFIETYVDMDTMYYYKNNSIIIGKYNIWCTIPIEKGNSIEALIEEKNDLEEYLRDIKRFAPKNLFENKVDFSNITAEEFEKLCSNVLENEGYTNIEIRGNLNAQDGGVDIEADKVEKSGRIKHAIFQCKHTKKQIPRQDLDEVRYLKEEFNADIYGIFYTGMFSPGTLDRIKIIEKTDKIKIIKYDKNKLETILYYNPKMKYRFFNI